MIAALAYYSTGLSQLSFCPMSVVSAPVPISITVFDLIPVIGALSNSSNDRIKLFPPQILIGLVFKDRLSMYAT